MSLKKRDVFSKENILFEIDPTNEMLRKIKKKHDTNKNNSEKI